VGDDTLHSTCVEKKTQGPKKPVNGDNGTWEPISTFIKMIKPATTQAYLHSRKDGTVLHTVLRKVHTALRETHKIYIKKTPI
jgi:hypothetical protein